MESYTVIARRYRPQTFDEVVGQEAIATTLRNSVREGRIAHAFLFSGSRGVGKTSMARILAKALNCKKGPTADPCDECDICRSIADCADSDVIEIDAASNTGVDHVRDLRDNIRYAPLRDRFKVYIIDEAHMLSKGAWNAFLKTLEEPPAHAKFVFATTEAHKVPDTIRSRCQQYEFRRITTADVVGRLEQVCKKEKVKCPAPVLQAVARAGQGSMRDAQSLLDQAIAYADGAPTLEHVWDVLGHVPHAKVLDLVDEVVKADFQALLLAADELLSRGRDPGVFLDQLTEQFRQMLLLTTCGRDFALVDVDPADRARVEEGGRAFGVDGLTTAIHVLGEARRRLRDVGNPRILLELTLIKLARVRDLLDMGSVVERLESVARMDAGSAPTATAVVPGAPAARPAPPAPAPAAAIARPAAPAATAPPPRGAGARGPARSAPPTREPVEVRAAPPPPPPAADPGDSSDDDAPPPIPAGEPTLERIQGLWPGILEAVRKRSMMIGAYVREAAPVRLVGRELTLAFAGGFVFHKDNLEKDANRQVVEAVIESILGVRLSLHVTLGGPGAPATSSGPEPSPSEVPPDAPAAPPRGGRAQAATQEPSVKKALDIFGARIVNVEE